MRQQFGGQKLICFLCLLSASTTMKPSGSFYKFTNVQCDTFNRDIVEFPKCFIKAIDRNANSLTIHATLHKVITAATVRATLLKRETGWKPFLYNITFDGCKFLRNRKSNPVALFFYSIIADYVNLNHTCPYDHNIALNEFRIFDENVRLPFPQGEYAMDTAWKLNGVWRARINTSLLLFVPNH